MPIPTSSASRKGRGTSAAPRPTFRGLQASPCGVRPEKVFVRFGLSGHPHRAITDHPVDGAIAVAELAKNLAGMLADAWRGASDRRFIDLKPCRRLWLPYPSDHRLVELGDGVARHHLLVMDCFAPAPCRRAG